MMKPKIYISSTGVPSDEGNSVERQLATASILVELGCNPYVPLFNHFVHIRWQKNNEVWRKLDLEWLSVCDAVYRLSGASEKTKIEVEFANLHNIPLLHSIEDTIAFIEKFKIKHRKRRKI